MDLEAILKPEVIIQGALGSFLFWLCYQAITKLGSRTSSLFGRFNKSWRKESLLFEQLQSQFMVAPKEKRAEYLSLCIYGAISRAAQGLIYLCLGLVAYAFVGPVSIFAFMFSIVYFSRAMRAVHLEVSDGKSIDWHRARVAEIDKELEGL